MVVKPSGPAQPKQTVPTGLSGEPPVGPAMPVIATDQSARLRRNAPCAIAWALATLPPIQRTLVLLRDLEGHSYLEMAAITGLEDDAASQDVAVEIERGLTKDRWLLQAHVSA